MRVRRPLCADASQCSHQHATLTNAPHWVSLQRSSAMLPSAISAYRRPLIFSATQDASRLRNSLTLQCLISCLRSAAAQQDRPSYLQNSLSTPSAQRLAAPDDLRPPVSFGVRRLAAPCQLHKPQRQGHWCALAGGLGNFPPSTQSGAVPTPTGPCEYRLRFSQLEWDRRNILWLTADDIKQRSFLCLVSPPFLRCGQCPPAELIYRAWRRCR
jgi:hypothetical protein